MDQSAIIGFVAALLGAAVGALGTYYATVGAAQQQGQARVRAATGAIRAQVSEQQLDVAEILERLANSQRQLGRLIGGVRSTRDGRPYLIDGQTTDPQSSEAFKALMGGPPNFGLTGMPASAWTAVLAPDAAHLKPALYNALVVHEALVGAINDLSKQGLPILLPLYASISEVEVRTLSTLAELDQQTNGGLLTPARHLIALYAASVDLFQNLATLERELG